MPPWTHPDTAAAAIHPGRARVLTVECHVLTGKNHRPFGMKDLIFERTVVFRIRRALLGVGSQEFRVAVMGSFQ
jgi:hypothetical protein